MHYFTVLSMTAPVRSFLHANKFANAISKILSSFFHSGMEGLQVQVGSLRVRRRHGDLRPIRAHMAT